MEEKEREGPEGEFGLAVVDLVGERRTSQRSTTSADHAMQRAARTLIAATEEARAQFRRDESVRRPETSYNPSTRRESNSNGGGGGNSGSDSRSSSSHGVVERRPATAGHVPCRQESTGSNGVQSGRGSHYLTDAFQGNGYSQTTSEGSPPLPPWPQGQFPTVQSSPVPPAQQFYQMPEASSARINMVTPPPAAPEDGQQPPQLLLSTGGQWATSSNSTPTVMAFSQPISMPGSSRSNKAPDVLGPPEPVHVRSSSLQNSVLGTFASVEARRDSAVWEAGLGPRDGEENAEEKRTSRFCEGRPPFSLFHEICFVAVICLAQLLMFASFAQGLTPARDISSDFADEPQAAHGAWYSAAFALSAGAFALPAIRLGSLFGSKKVFVLGFFWFSAWSVLAGLGHYVEKAGGNGMAYLCACRAMQGIGPAMVVPNGQLLLGRAYILGPRRNFVMCLFGTSAPAGFAVGAVMASLFSKLTMWQWAFFVLGAVCLTLACQSILILPPDHVPPKTMGVSYTTLLDAPGIILSVSGLALFAFAWNQAPVAGWDTPYIYFLLIIGMLLMTGFLYVESRSRHALLPTGALNLTNLFVLACLGAGWGCFSAWVFYTFQFLVEFRRMSPLLASAAFAAMPVTGLIASALVGFLLRRVTPYRVLLVAMGAFVAGSVVMATAPVGQTFWLQTFVSILLVPVGMAASVPVAAVIVSNAVGREHRGLATAGLVPATVFTSIAVGLGVAGTVETYVKNDGARGDDNVLAGYRGALWVAVGMAGVGFVLAALGALIDSLWPAEPEEGAVLRIGKPKGHERPNRPSLAVGVSP